MMGMKAMMGLGRSSFSSSVSSLGSSWVRRELSMNTMPFLVKKRERYSSQAKIST